LLRNLKENSERRKRSEKSRKAEEAKRRPREIKIIERALIKEDLIEILSESEEIKVYEGL
jgi:hypothetical protein